MDFLPQWCTSIKKKVLTINKRISQRKNCQIKNYEIQAVANDLFYSRVDQWVGIMSPV